MTTSRPPDYTPEIFHMGLKEIENRKASARNLTADVLIGSMEKDLASGHLGSPEDPPYLIVKSYLVLLKEAQGGR